MKKSKKMFTGLTLTSLMVLGVACSNGNQSAKESGTATKKTEQVEKDTKEKKKDNDLPEGVAQFKSYKSDWSDNSWSGVTVKISDINVGRFTEPQSDSNGETADGTIVVNFDVSTTDTDINIYPNQAKLLTNNGDQIEADLIESDSNIGGEYLAGSKKSGQVIFMVPNMNDIKDITSVRITFLGNLATSDTENIDIYNYTHDYDTGTLELK